MWKTTQILIFYKTYLTMAEVNTNASHAASRKAGLAKHRSTKIDMTPMVDLAFLLLTFFILTTTFNKSRVLEVGMPDKQGGSSPVSAKNVLNLVLVEDNKIFWWMGVSPPVVSTDYSAGGVRKLLLEKSGDNPRLIVLIKPKDHARFQNVVDILDEMEITGTQRFAILDFSDDDRVMLQGQ